MATVEERTLAKAFIHIDEVTDTWLATRNAEMVLAAARQKHEQAKARLYDFARITRS